MDAVYQTLQRTARRKHSLKRLTVSMRCVMFVSETVPKRQYGQLALVKKKKKDQKRMNEEHFAQMKIKRKIEIEFEMAMILSRENNASVASTGIHCSNGDAHWKQLLQVILKIASKNSKFRQITEHFVSRYHHLISATPISFFLQNRLDEKCWSTVYDELWIWNLERLTSTCCWPDGPCYTEKSKVPMNSLNSNVTSTPCWQIKIESRCTGHTTV
ncbi:hypothetical protein T06_8052 [Trichinella sp. T6]|nr:hypothetical protein T06_8052 [Trichinella sp. T6]